MKINIGDTITTKKVHPCGSNVWTIVRTGADVKIKCTKCERVIMFPLDKLDKIIKK
ncbi:MAG: DUF951 domain-containing protein [Clostridia bacterium]|nr:DUF951 domain-containing protein [Clostridia bacterium]